MKYPIIAFLILCLGTVAVRAEVLNETSQAREALRILAEWQQPVSADGTRELKIICWTPQDRPFPERDAARLDGIMKHVQSFYATQMERHGFGPLSFNLPLDQSGQLQILRVTGDYSERHYQKSSGNEIRQECARVLEDQGVVLDQETILIFCNLGFWDPEAAVFTHRSPYYAGGNQAGGTAWQLDSPELSVENMKLKSPVISDGEYGRISLGRHNSIFIGGIAHELGHALGLPHCSAREDEVRWGTALMGSGNRTYGQELRGEGRGTFLTFAHAMRLASHPQFSESVRGMKQEVQTTVSEMALRVEKSQIVVSGKISGMPPVYGVVAYFDPAGHGDYDSLTSTAVPSADGLFEIRSPDLPAGTSGQLRLIPLHVNGAIASPPVRGQLAYSYRVSAEGKPDVEEAALRLELAEFLRALETNQRQLAEAMLSSIQSVRGKRIAGRLLHPPERTLSPQGVAQEVHTIPLSECRPEKVQVGWARPAYDRIPDPAVLLESAGQIFETGIYAHAESVHQYDLGQRWQKLTGQVGLASGQPGSVQFQIRGDGKTLWTSRRIGPEERESFEISVEGLQKLELLTSPTDDGKNNDWGLWLNVRLQRP